MEELWYKDYDNVFMTLNPQVCLTLKHALLVNGHREDSREREHKAVRIYET